MLKKSSEYEKNNKVLQDRMKYWKTSIFLNLTVPKHLAPDETPQYLSKTTKLAYAPRKHEKSLIKFKKIWK